MIQIKNNKKIMRIWRKRKIKMKINNNKIITNKIQFKLVKIKRKINKN